MTKTVFGKGLEFSWKVIKSFCSNLGHLEMGWELVLLAF